MLRSRINRGIRINCIMFSYCRIFSNHDMSIYLSIILNNGIFTNGSPRSNSYIRINCYILNILRCIKNTSSLINLFVSYDHQFNYIQPSCPSTFAASLKSPQKSQFKNTFDF